MKKFLTFIIALLVSGLGLNAQNFDVIDPELQTILNQKSNDLISINIVMESQHDGDDLDVKFANIKDKDEKRKSVIAELKKYSSDNQNKVMSYLQAEGKNVTNLKSHWLVNTISCTASRDAIYGVSELSGISVIAHNGKEKLINDYKPVKVQKQRGLTENITQVGANSVWAEGYTGKDVIVAVLDSGVNSEHVDLKDHLWDGGSEYPDHGWNFIDNNYITDDYNGHGTHCAGTICGDGTSGTQTGIAPDATLMCVKVLGDDGLGTLEALVSGVEFAVENGADILSLSLGWTYPDSYESGIMREMFENVMYAGVVASVAAGNERDGIDTIPIPYNISAPGNCPPPWLHPDQQANAGGLSAVVSVGAVDYYDEPAYFSSEGPVTWQGSQWHDYLLDLDVEIDEHWLHYDNDNWEEVIGGPESFYWGVMFPAATLQQHNGDMLSKISVYDYVANTIELLVYYGGDYAPEMLVHTQTFELTGSNSVVEIDLTNTLPIDKNENLWIVLFSNNGTVYPAASCSNTGDPNGRWISIDGTIWEDIVDYGLEYTWMIRAYVSDESGSAVAELKTINDYEYKSAKGTLSALKADNKRSGAASNDSNFGLIRPDVSAPGVDIVSAAYDDNDGFYTFSGTSMATPCVAGVMALMLDKNPNLTPTDICRILETTATPLDYKKSNRTGSGRINAYEACEMIEEGTEETIPGKSFFTFESGLEGWTTIDADSDGYKWINSSDLMGEGQGFNGSNCAMSQSYDAGVGAALNPDNYLVSPEKYLIDSSSKIKFMAAAQDPLWAAEHFGVAVSTASNNNANDFTTIAEWTMTSGAKGNQKSQARGFEAKAEGTWFQYEVDLSQYAGQEVWLAIRHFNCIDQFILCVDNVEIVTLSLQIPSAPQNLVAEAISSSEIQLTWDSVYNAEYYNVYYGDTFIGTDAATACIVNVVDYGTYCFTVTAVNEAGESEHSNEACATVEDILPEDACYVYFELYDSYGDTWNGNYLLVEYNGKTEKLEMINSSFAEYALTIPTGSYVTVTHIGDSWPYENSFVVRYENGTKILNVIECLADTIAYGFYVDCSMPATLPSAPTNLRVTVEEDDPDYYEKYKITLTWDAVENANEYAVHSKTQLQSPNIEYVDTNRAVIVKDISDEGEWWFYVSAVYENNTASEFSEPCYIVLGGSVISHTQALKSGWNWYSTYVVNEGTFGLEQLENAVGANGIQIKNQSRFVNKADSNWYGTMTSTAVEDMYMIYMSETQDVTLEGYEVNPSNYPMTLNTNWKWISYPLSSEMSVEEAFASANPSDGDYIKSQTGFAQYYQELGWNGTLKTMTPGMGYMYQNTSGYEKTFYYPTSSYRSESASESESINHWYADYAKYPMNMTMIAVVEGASSDYEVAAFVDGECRGNARPVYIEALDKYVLFMTIYGDKTEKMMTFKYYDVKTGETYSIADEITFSVNATVGDVMKPYVMTRGALGIDELSSSIDIYPNPIGDVLFLATEMNVKEVSIYDIYGRMTTVYSLQSTDFVHSIDVADLEAGVYFVNIKTENGNVVKRFVKK